MARSSEKSFIGAIDQGTGSSRFLVGLFKAAVILKLVAFDVVSILVSAIR